MSTTIDIETLTTAIERAERRTGWTLGFDVLDMIGDSPSFVKIVRIDDDHRCDALTDYDSQPNVVRFLDNLETSQLILVCGPMGEAIWEVAIPPHRLRHEWLITPGEMVAKRDDGQVLWTDAVGGPVIHPRVLAMIARLN